MLVDWSMGSAQVGVHACLPSGQQAAYVHVRQLHSRTLLKVCFLAIASLPAMFSPLPRAACQLSTHAACGVVCRAVSAQASKGAKELKVTRAEWQSKFGDALFKQGTNPPDVMDMAKVAVKDKRGNYGINCKLLQKFIDKVGVMPQCHLRMVCLCRATPEA